MHGSSQRAEGSPRPPGFDGARNSVGGGGSALLDAATFERRLVELSRVVNAVEELRRAFVAQHPEYAEGLPRVP